MDEEESLDGMDDEESKNPLAFLGLQRFTINATKSLLYFLLYLLFASVFNSVFAFIFASAEVWHHRQKPFCISTINITVVLPNILLIRVGSDAEESPMKKAKGNGIELNARGIPARKRKKNSLIYGADDLVGIFIIFLLNQPLSLISS